MRPFVSRTALAAACCLITGTVALAPLASAAAGENLPVGRELTITNRYALPILELSGLATARTAPTKSGATGTRDISLYAVGDKTYDVVTFYIAGSSGGIAISVKDAAPALGKRASTESQWEAVAIDDLDTICMLSETRSEMPCFDRGLEESRGIIKLDTSPLKHLDRLWGNRPNSRGEGMLLMKKGHMLVLKEKNPSLLVEFGPRGDAPMGYGPETFLQPGEAFTLPSPQGPDQQDPALAALKTWEFSDRLRELATDASEITLGPDGHVYLLSQQSLVLVRLEKVLKPDEDKVNVDNDAWWTLPRGIGKAEGLVIDGERRPWIGIDIKQKGKPNLFRLSPL